MGQQTEHTVWTVRNTHRGSDHYGACEICGKPCSEHFVAANSRIWVRDNGQHYMGFGDGGVYGHLDCLTKKFGNLISQETLQRDGRVLLLPDTVFDDLQKRI